MDNIITVTTENNQQVNIEVLDIFSVVGYDGKDYILYTQNQEIDNDNIKAYISILENKDGNYSLVAITDDKEWTEVQKAIQEMEDEVNEQRR